MNKLFINLTALFVVSILYYFSISEVHAWAGINNIDGQVLLKGTNAPLANVWVKWEVTREENIVPWPKEPGRDVKYVRTDSAGKFVFPYWFNPVSQAPIGEPLLFENFNYRAKEYLTWIKPNQPEVQPDTSAYDNIYLPTVSSFTQPGTNYVGDSFNKALDAINQASNYKPSESGWVRKASTPNADAFQCGNQPTISVVTPNGWAGTWENNGVFPVDYFPNDRGPLTIPTMYFTPSDPINFNPTSNPTSIPVQSTQPTSSTLPGTSPQPTGPGTVQNPTSSNITPSVDIWAASGVNVTGRNTPGGTLRVDPSQPFTLFWTAANASTCVASGNWAGIKRAGSTAQSKLVNQTEPLTTYTYTLTCFNNESGNQESDTVLVQIAASDVDPFLQTTEGDVHSNQDINLPKD